MIVRRRSLRNGQLLTGQLLSTIFLLLGLVPTIRASSDDLSSKTNHFSKQDVYESFSKTDLSNALANVEAFQISDVEDLIEGPASQGRIGDFMLRNDAIRVVIQAPGWDAGASPYGGNIIDADIVRPGNEDNDQFGEISLFFDLALTSFPDPNDDNSMRVVSDGSNGTAIIEACGSDHVFDYLDLIGTLDAYPLIQGAIPYDGDSVYGLEICTRYSLEPGKNYVTIETVFSNPTDDDIFTPIGDVIDGGGDVELFVPNPTGEPNTFFGEDYVYGGFGEQDYARLDILGFFGKGVSYGYVAPYEDGELVDGFLVSTAGITVTVFGTDKILATIRGKNVFLTRIPAHGEATVTRYFVVGEDLGDITDEAYQIRGLTTGTVSGRVTEGSSGGEGLEGVRVTVVSEDATDSPVTQFYTDENGYFEGTLPAGSEGDEYGLIAAQGFYFMDDGRPEEHTPQTFTLKAGESVTKNLVLEETGHLHLTVLDGADSSQRRKVPAKAIFFGTDSTAPFSSLMDVKDDFVEEGMARLIFLPTGEGTFDIKPGTYDLVINRGFEYDQFVLNNLTISPGVTSEVTAVLTRVVDTTGYLSADMHVHGINSPDSPVDKETRVASFLADNVEILVSTDHDFITDYRPTIDEMDVSDNITSIIGQEVTTWLSGHFNVFPLRRDPESRTGGAVNWMESAPGRGNCIGYSGTQEPYDNLTVPRIFEVAETCLAAEDTIVKQVNHARFEFQGYFGQIGLNLAAFGTPDVYTADPEKFRMPEGLNLFDIESFNSFEIQNQGSVAMATTLLNDWFGLIHLGYPKAGTAVSDTHTEIHEVSGYGRSWIHLGTDDPGSAHNAPTFPKDFADAVVGMHLTSGIGPFVTASATNSQGEEAAMGDVLPAFDGEVALDIRIQNPAWVDYHRVDIFVNPIIEANSNNEEYDNPSDLNPTYTFCAGSASSNCNPAVAPNFVSYFDPATVNVPTTGPDTFRWEADLHLELNLDRDAWIVVVVWDGKAQSYEGYSQDVLSFTNPIFIDRDGGGWTAPCSDYNADLGCAYLKEDSSRFGERSETRKPRETLELEAASRIFGRLYATMHPDVVR